MPKNKEEFKKQMRGHSKGTEEPNERVRNGQSQNNLSNKINNVLLDYNPKNKVNIHESILT